MTPFRVVVRKVGFKRFTVVSFFKSVKLLVTTTLNGVTCANNGDGTYTLNGTATKLIDLDLTTSLTIENGKEYLMCFPSPSSSVKIYLMNGQSPTEAYGSNPTQFKYIDKTNSNKAVHLVINSGYVCNSLIVKPMITTNLSATYDDFVPFSIVKEVVKSRSINFVAVPFKV